MLIFERYSDQAGYGLDVPRFGVRFTAGSKHFSFPPRATDCEEILAQECCWKYSVRGRSGIIWLRIKSSDGIFLNRAMKLRVHEELQAQFYSTHQRNTHF